MLEQQVQLTGKWIKAYAKAIDAPALEVSGRIMAPSTMIAVFWQVFSESPISENGAWLHVKQRCSYQTPLLADMVLDCQLEQVKDKTVKHMRYGEFKLSCFHEGKLIAVSHTTLMRDETNAQKDNR
jgi:hypothetical protein